MKNYKKGFIVPLLIAIVVVLIIGGGVYIYSQNNKGPNIDNPKNKIVPNNNSASSTPEKTKDGKSVTKQVSVVTTNPTPAPTTFSISGYVVYTSPSGEVGCGILPDGRSTTPCDPEYEFMIIGNNNTLVNGVLPSMSGFPLTTDSGYKYISLKGFLGEIPNTGKSVIVHGTIDNKVKLRPPYTFTMTATSIGLK